MDNNVGERIKKSRLDKNLTMSELATLAGTSYNTIYRAESNTHCTTDRLLYKIATALGCDISYLKGTQYDSDIIINKIRSLDESERKMVNAFIDFIKSRH